MKLVVRLGAVSLTLAAVGAFLGAGCSSTPTGAPEAVATTAEAIHVCNPACNQAWTDCMETVIKGTPTDWCGNCGGLGQAPCDASGPNQGCNLQSGQTAVYMGTINGLCAACGDINQPACDATWQPPRPVGTTNFLNGCDMVSQLVPQSIHQPLQVSGGTCVRCGGPNDPSCQWFSPGFCELGNTPVSLPNGACVGCGSPGAPQCYNYYGDSYPACSGGLVDVSGTCQDNYGNYAAFFNAIVPTKNLSQSSPVVVPILAANDALWATAQGGDGTDTAANLKAFAAAYAQSATWAAVSSEYNLGTLTAAAAVSGPALTPSNGTTLTQADVKNYVSSLGSAVPPANNNVSYLLYIPPTVPLDPTSWAGSATAKTACAYHLGIGNSTTASISIVARCLPNNGNDTVIDQMTNEASHEIFEAATNPNGKGYNFGVKYDSAAPPVTLYAGAPEPVSIWESWNGGNVELGDFCEGTRTIQTIGGQSWEFQRMFSNAAAQRGGDPCIPAAADTYFSVSIPQEWYAVKPGGSVQIPMTGWSSAAISSDWFLRDRVMYSAPNTGLSLGTVTSSLGNGVGPGVGCNLHPLMNNGHSATVTVTASSSACNGDYIVARVESFEENVGVNCNPAVTNDSYHFWPVGVYVQGASCSQ